MEDASCAGVLVGIILGVWMVVVEGDSNVDLVMDRVFRSIENTDLQPKKSNVTFYRSLDEKYTLINPTIVILN